MAIKKKRASLLRHIRKLRRTLKKTGKIIRKRHTRK
jgi:hypothetical protein